MVNRVLSGSSVGRQRSRSALGTLGVVRSGFEAGSAASGHLVAGLPRSGRGSVGAALDRCQVFYQDLLAQRLVKFSSPGMKVYPNPGDTAEALGLRTPL